MGDQTRGSPPLDLRIAPDLIGGRLRPHFEKTRRLHLPGFLVPPAADRLHDALARSTGWTRSTLGGGTPIDIPVSALDVASDAERDALIASAHVEARDGFHYMFDSLRLSDLIEQGAAVDPDLAALYVWLNSAAFLDFVRDLSGVDGLSYVDAQATRYMPGHYLNLHDDQKDGSGRELAYVLNLTSRWRVDWGGLLAFVEPDGHVAEAYTPAFNALNLFRVPQPHTVTPVAAFAGARACRSPDGSGPTADQASPKRKRRGLSPAVHASGSGL